VAVVEMVAVAVMATTAAVTSDVARARARMMAFAVAMALLVERPVAVARV
jgi:hypothetical protein